MHLVTCLIALLVALAISGTDILAQDGQKKTPVSGGAQPGSSAPALASADQSAPKIYGKWAGGGEHWNFEPLEKEIPDTNLPRFDKPRDGWPDPIQTAGYHLKKFSRQQILRFSFWDQEKEKKFVEDDNKEIADLKAGLKKADNALLGDQYRKGIEQRLSLQKAVTDKGALFINFKNDNRLGFSEGNTIKAGLFLQDSPLGVGTYKPLDLYEWVNIVLHKDKNNTPYKLDVERWRLKYTHNISTNSANFGLINNSTHEAYLVKSLTLRPVGQAKSAGLSAEGADKGMMP